jgi:type IV secretory pathway VirJ component
VNIASSRAAWAFAAMGWIIFVISDAGAPAKSGPSLATKSAAKAFRASVVLISGDRGWGVVEKGLEAGFTVQRMAVSRVDSSLSFASSRSLEEIAREVEASIEDRRPVVLVGYSFGADLIPMVWSKLQASFQNRVITIALIAPTHTGSTVIDPTDRYDPSELPMTVLAEHHAKLPADRVMCIFGREERLSGYSSCPDRHLSKSHLIEIDGGHELGGHATFIASEIAKFARDRTHSVAGLN